MMKCPDCGAELDTIVVEVCRTKLHTVNYDTKQLEPKHPHDEWEEADIGYRCPNHSCGTLNVDAMFYEFDLIE